MQTNVRSSIGNMCAGKQSTKEVSMALRPRFTCLLTLESERNQGEACCLHILHGSSGLQLTHAGISAVFAWLPEVQQPCCSARACLARRLVSCSKHPQQLQCQIQRSRQFSSPWNRRGFFVLATNPGPPREQGEPRRRNLPGRRARRQTGCESPDA